MSWKNVFVKEDSAAAAQSSGTRGNDAPRYTPPVSSAPPRSSYLDGAPTSTRATAPAAATTPSGAADPQFDAELKKLRDEMPTPKGFQEFLVFIQNMRAFIPDEAKLLEAAFTHAQSLGLTPKLIRDTVANMLKQLASRRAQFQSDLQADERDMKDGNLQQIETIGRDMTAKQDQVSTLNRQIAQLTDQRATLERELKAVDSKVAAVNARFDSAFNKHTTELQQLLDKLGK
jgi:hypothetical protein